MRRNQKKTVQGIRVLEAGKELSIILDFNVDEVRTDCCILFDTSSVAGSKFSLSWTGVRTCLVAFFGGIVAQETNDDLKDDASFTRGRNAAWPLSLNGSKSKSQEDMSHDPNEHIKSTAGGRRRFAVRRTPCLQPSPITFTLCYSSLRTLSAAALIHY
jgi:hypothetical protein